MFNLENEIVFLSIVNGIISRIVTPIKNAISSMFTPLFDFAQNNIAKFITYLIEVVFKAGGPIFVAFVSLTTNFLGTILTTLFNALWEEVGLNAILANGAVKFAGKMHEAIINNEAIAMLGYTPKDFFQNIIVSFSTNVTDKNELALIRKTTNGTTNPYNIVIKVMQEAVLPSAMVIFSLIVLVELFQIAIRTEGMRNSGFETPFKLMLKVAICKLILDNSVLILESIIGFGQEMFLKAYEGQYTFNAGTYFWQTIAGKLASQVWYAIIIVYLQIFLQYVFIKVVMLIIPFLVFGRMVELYVMIALAPIPFSTFASQEFSQIGKSFLKQLVGIAMKALIMYLIILIFTSLFTVMTFDLDYNDVDKYRSIMSTGMSDVITRLLKMVLKPLVFAFMMLAGVSSADKYVRMITGAMY